MVEVNYQTAATVLLEASREYMRTPLVALPYLEGVAAALHSQGMGSSADELVTVTLRHANQSKSLRFGTEIPVSAVNRLAVVLEELTPSSLFVDGCHGFPPQ